MSANKHIDKICISAVAISLVITIIFMSSSALGVTASAKQMKYESTLFDNSYVHQIDIVMNDWDGFIENCENEEYSACTVVIDGNKYGNTAIRAKGNTSLSSVRTMGSQRYSFKLEFDHYENGKSMDGLDKLCLNNLIQDNTMMKDYLVYQLMKDFEVDSPLCSFAYITVNGEDWGLYLAVEGIEDSFLSRNYGSDTGDLYKPDSMSFGGGRGNGKDFDMGDFDFGDMDLGDMDFGNMDFGSMDFGSMDFGNMDFGSMDFGNMDFGNMDFGNMDFGNMDFGNMDFGNMDFGNINPEDFGFGGSDSEASSSDSEKNVDTKQRGFENAGGMGGFGGFGGGMGSSDVKLQYIDDDASSYSNIFNNAKTDVTSSDKNRLIESLKKLSSYSELEDVLDMDEVLRYFVVHNFVCNGDSYTGSMIHNYYLHEKDGKLGMIPWDYNLAFGTFQGGNASSSINADIDKPVSGGNMDDRPMVGWIFSDEKYTEEYHQLFISFVNKWFSDGQLEKMIDETADMIRTYVEKDPTKFCTSEEFEKGVTAISTFVSLRGEAVKKQLAGDKSTVDAGSLNSNDMGSMGGGFGGGGFGGGSRMSKPDSAKDTQPDTSDGQAKESIEVEKQSMSDSRMMQGMQPPDGMEIPENKAESDGKTATGNGDKSDEKTATGENEQSEKPKSSEGMGKQERMGKNGESASASGSFSRESFSASVSRSENGNWIMIGASVLVLIAGLLIAIKKKY